jgi:hypothetical protein
VRYPLVAASALASGPPQAPKWCWSTSRISVTPQATTPMARLL